MESAKHLVCAEPSICIPRVSLTISKENILSVFNRFELGKISCIDTVQRNADTEFNAGYQKVFIHFHKWSDNPVATQIRNRLLSGKEVKIIYDSPWFWKLSANKSKKN
jgi:hypothetical protein